MAKAGTPGNPAPDNACIVFTITWLSPNLSASGFNTSANPTVVQLGLVTIKPSHFRDLFCSSITLRWPRFTSAIRSGTSGSILCALASLITGNPDFANSSSALPATSEGSGEKTRSASTLEGFVGCTSISANSLGMFSETIQFTASPYLFPTDLSPVRVETVNIG